MKKLLTTLLFAASAFAQVTTYEFEGDGCGQTFGCMISPAQDVAAPWGANAPVGGGTPSAHYTVMTGLNVTLSSYPSFAAIPQHLTSVGTGTFTWFNGVGGSGSFTLPVTSTWDYTPIPNPILPNNPIREFTEVVTTPTDSVGDSVTYTRHWIANPGRFGRWSLTRLVEGNLGAGSIVDTSTLTYAVPAAAVTPFSSTVAILDAPVQE